MSIESARSSLQVAMPRPGTASGESQRMRLGTLVRLRWFSVAGQTAACVFVAWGLWFPYPVLACLALIALSAALNFFLTRRFPTGQRLSARAASLVLAFDVLQPAALMFLTGGLTNPFSLFIILPAIVAAATQPAITVIALSFLAVLATSLLAFLHLPLPWPASETFALPAVYVGGLWFAIVNTILFATFYVYRVAAEARILSDALGATELVLQREQHLSALDGLAAAAAHELGTPLSTIAIVAKEMRRASAPSDPMREDIDLLIAQSQRCRDILARLASLSSSSEVHYARLPLTSLVEEVIAPHQGFGVAITRLRDEREGAEPVLRRNAGIVYGLGNIVENAVDFARSEVSIATRWTAREITILVRDDGSGFSPETLARIGEPYVSRRRDAAKEASGNLGLGLFIATTLLERSGARLDFRNRADGKGAEVEIRWPHEALAEPPAEPDLLTDTGEDLASATATVPAQ